MFPLFLHSETTITQTTIHHHGPKLIKILTSDTSGKVHGLKMFLQIWKDFLKCKNKKWKTLLCLAGITNMIWLIKLRLLLSIRYILMIESQICKQMQQLIWTYHQESRYLGYDHSLKRTNNWTWIIGVSISLLVIFLLGWIGTTKRREKIRSNNFGIRNYKMNFYLSSSNIKRTSLLTFIAIFTVLTLELQWRKNWIILI